MKRIFSSLTAFCAVVMLFSCSKSVNDVPTTQGLKVSMFDHSSPRPFLVPCRSTGISRGPGFQLTFETQDYVVHIKSITFDVVSLSKKAVTAMSLDQGYYWGGGTALSVTKSVQDGKVTFIGDFSVSPGSGGSSIDVGVSLAGISADVPSGTEVAISVSEITYFSEKDSRYGVLNPKLTTAKNVLLYTVPYLAPVTGYPAGSIGPVRVGLVEFLALQCSSDIAGNCKISSMPILISSHFLSFDSQNKTIYARDEAGVLLGTAQMPSNAGGDVLFNFANLIVPAGGYRYIIFSAYVGSMDNSNIPNITAQAGDWSTFVWSDTQTNTQISLLNQNKNIWNDNGYSEFGTFNSIIFK
ncbi:MAG: hypothetical protein WCQ32_03010 [bacterium]